MEVMWVAEKPRIADFNLVLDSNKIQLPFLFGTTSKRVNKYIRVSYSKY